MFDKNSDTKSEKKHDTKSANKRVVVRVRFRDNVGIGSTHEDKSSYVRRVMTHLDAVKVDGGVHIQHVDGTHETMHCDVFVPETNITSIEYGVPAPVETPAT